MTMALEGGEGSASRPGRSLPLGETRYPLYRRLGGTQGRSGLVWKISPPPGFDPRTVQLIASRYADYATRPTTEMNTRNISFGGKGGWCIGLTTLPLSFTDCLEIWEPQTPGTLRACPGL